MTISNVAFITFLALKNTPLAYLTAYSYERLNPLHQVAGYTTVSYALLHGILVSVSFIQLHSKNYLLEAPQLHAITAASAFFVLLVFALLVKGIRYEVFYISHILMYMVIIINVGFHRPLLSTRSVIITGFAGGLWGLDRLLRAGRILWYAYDNSAKITPLPHGGTRIVLQRSPSRAVAGTHCFLWIPKIRAFETHPFTIIRATPLSLDMVVAAHDGFTDDLHSYAAKHPGAILRASIDGPYGQLPNFSKVADKVILVAGGSGATFTFGVALDMIKKLGDSAKPTIEFIWTVKEEGIYTSPLFHMHDNINFRTESLSWFSKELMELQASPRVTIALHSTRPNCTQSPSSPISPLDENPSVLQLENTSPIPKSSTQQGDLLSRAFSADPEKHLSPQHGTPLDFSTSLEILHGRPDVEALIKDVVAKAGKDERVLIAACGPEGLMWSVRRTAAGCITAGGASVELYCEQFGW
jgi:NAD(P)H-flavin reductase